MVYETTLESDESYNIENILIYNSDRFFSNRFNLEKKWYIPNGSIIGYKLSKPYLFGKCELYEEYLICEKPYFDGSVTHYEFRHLDKQLFKEFMSGNITIEDVLKHKNNNPVKQKIK